MEAVARVFPGSQMFRTPCFPCRGPGVDPMGTKMLIASGHDSDYCVWTPLINLSVRVSSVIQSCPTLQLHELQHNRPPCPSPSPGVHSNSCLSKVGDTIKPSHSLSSPSPPAPNPSQHQGLLQWVNSSHELAKVLEFQLQHQSFQRTPRTDLFLNGLVGSPCSPRDSQESSPTPQFKSINSLVLGFLHSPTLTSIYEHWKNQSLD